MAKRCEICGKGPVVGRNISHAHNVSAAAVRAEPSARPGDGQRRHPAAPRLHALPPLGQGRQGRLDRATQAVSTAPARPTAIGPYSQAIRAGHLLFVSGQVPLDPATGQLVDGDIAAQTRRVFENLGALLRPPARSFDARRPHDGLPGRHERLRGDERGLRHVLHRARPGARDRAGRAAAERRARRNRRHRQSF